MSFNCQIHYGHDEVVGRARWGRKSRLRGIAFLVGPCCFSWSCIFIEQNHRIIEQFGLEWTYKGHLVQIPHNKQRLI